MGREADQELTRRVLERVVFTRTDADVAGLTDHQCNYRVATRQWATVHRGVYATAGARLQWQDALQAACTAGGPSAVASHRSALALYDLPGGRRFVPEITTPRWLRARRPGLVVHETAHLPACDTTELEGVPVTAPARTLVDAGAVLHPSTLALAVDEALRRDLVTFDALCRRLEELARPGRRGIKALRTVLAARHPDAALTESVREHLLLEVLRRAGLPRPIPQFEVRGTDGRLVARVDAAYPDIRLALEYDSYLFHGSRAKYTTDLGRRNRLTALGWRVVHISGTDLRSGAAQLVTDVRSLLEQHTFGVTSPE